MDLRIDSKHEGLRSKFSTMMSDDRLDAFKGVTRKPGLQIWTINKMKLVPVSARGFGNFFEGDCYIVLNISQNRGWGQTSDIHYWLGKASSVDEQGAAAIYVAQLDEHLGGGPVQHREVQGNESALFRSYFKKGLIYKKGGVASGFQHVDTNAYSVLRLLHIKGRKHVTATEVEVSWNSFNNGDIFLLDLGKAIVQWNGPQSNRREKLKAVVLAQDIRDRERGGRAQIGVVEGGEEQSSPELMKAMMAVLGQRSGPLKSATSDDTHELVQNNSIRLYHVFESNGNLVVQEVATQPLTQDLLLSSDCYILDHKGSSVMVWKGKKASKVERQAAFNRALGFIKAKKYPPNTRVEVMSEGGESAMFKQLFQCWRDRSPTGVGTAYNVGKIGKVDQAKFDVMQLHARPELAARHRMVDDASGDVKVWRLENSELAEVKPSMYGQFYGGDCYLVLYTYLKAGQPHYILYMWQGRHASKDEIAECATQADIIDNKYKGAPVQVRVVMGKEPRQFLALFKGKFIIFEGGTGRPGVVNSEQDARLFHVRGTDEMNTKATEVPPRASSLNSNDVFLLRTIGVCYLWYGKGCSGDERVMGRAVSDVLTRGGKQVVMEGQEPVEFWVALGGKAPYANDRLQREEPFHFPRLFECSNQTGHFRITEVYDFAQSDLDEEDVMLLDTWEEIFLWVGNFANKKETKEAWIHAQEYLRMHPAGRDRDTAIIFIKQGYEPPTFTGWFSSWDPHKWSEGNSYEQMKRTLSDAASFSQITVELNNASFNKMGDGGAPGSPSSTTPFYRVHGGNWSPKPMSPTSPSSQRPQFTMPLTQIDGPMHLHADRVYYEPKLLVNKLPDQLPPGVDPCQREDHLTDKNFEGLLGTSRLEFERLPKWRQNELKKKAGLF
ncbi:villin-1 isoform X2 [Takifugu flavidus]|uniref:villin-1 isoform X2 n=1 Tax=Takifugu flavidus TaxID=433684 RepID=UPI00254436FF|nr:villin-1 isoform X2 [Takifugu flavidus]